MNTGNATARILLILPILVAIASGPGPTMAAPVFGDAAVSSRQGGDTIADAVDIAVPCLHLGTTIGYADDYEESCPYDTTPAPDVVYRYAPDLDIVVDIDLRESLYDTQVFVYDEDLHLVACNDDHYGYQSFIGELSLAAGEVYFIVVDGWLNSEGEYVMRVTESVPCDLVCDGMNEGEPPLVAGYADVYNAGCTSPDGSFPMQHLDGGADGSVTICGRNGWYTDGYGVMQRDVDWYSMIIGATGAIEIASNQIEQSRIAQIEVSDCSEINILSGWDGHHCLEMTTVVHGEPGEEVWIAFTAREVEPPGGQDAYEYDYVLEFNGLGTTVRTEQRSWSSVKAKFR